MLGLCESGLIAAERTWSSVGYCGGLLPLICVNRCDGDGFDYKNNRLNHVGISVATGRETTKFCNNLKKYGIAKARAFCNACHRIIFHLNIVSNICGTKACSILKKHVPQKDS